jgi:hypothetical protein
VTAKKPKVPRSAEDREQSERFMQTAKIIGTDESGKRFAEAFEKAVPAKPKRKGR